MAHSLLAAGKFGEAAALFGRATERCQQAASKYEECSSPDQQAGVQLEALVAAAAAWGAVAAAELRAGGLREAAAAQEGLEGMSLQGPGAAAGAGSGARVCVCVFVCNFMCAAEGPILPLCSTHRSSSEGPGFGGMDGPCGLAQAGDCSQEASTIFSPPRLVAAGRKRARPDAYLAEELDAWESFVGPAKGQARLCRCRLPPVCVCVWLAARPACSKSLLVAVAVAVAEQPRGRCFLTQSCTEQLPRPL